MAANQVVADTLKIVGSSLLGLTVGCAQCHDHRYDPIPQSDYYRLRAVFEPALDPQPLAAAGAAAGLAVHRRRPREGRGRRGRGREAARRTSTPKAAASTWPSAFEKELTKFPAAEPRQAPRTPSIRRPPSAPPSRRSCSPPIPSVNISDGRALPVQPGGGRRTEEAASQDRRRSGPEKPVEDFVAVLSEVPGDVPATHIFHRGDPSPARRPRCSPAI